MTENWPENCSSLKRQDGNFQLLALCVALREKQKGKRKSVMANRFCG